MYHAPPTPFRYLSLKVGSVYEQEKERIVWKKKGAPIGAP
jgi:hypothetical protein